MEPKNINNTQETVVSRRNFLKNSVVLTGATGIAGIGVLGSGQPVKTGAVKS